MNKPEFIRYFNGLSWEVEQGIKDSLRTHHCKEVSREVISEGHGRTSVKVTFVDNTEEV